ncbi:MAG: c-type cytochrome [Bacteroidota bacterium]
MDRDRTITTRVLVFSFCMLLLGCTPQHKDQPFLLGSGYGVNDASLFVQDIEKTRTYYADTLGFTVRSATRKGTFDGTLSASISFGDMTAFELVSKDDSFDENRISPFVNSYLASNEGVRAFSLSSSSVDSTSAWLKSKGYDVDSVRTYRSSAPSEGWSRDDGAPNRKSLDFDADAPPAHLPRFIEKTSFDYPTVSDQWRSYYSFRRMSSNHPNGVVGISAIRIAVQDVKKTGQEFQNMGFEEVERNDKTAMFKLVRNQEVHLVDAGTDENVNEFLEQHGEGVFAIRFEVSDLDSTSRFLEQSGVDYEMNAANNLITIARDHAFGVHLEFIEEPEEQKAMAEMLSLSGKLDRKAIDHAANLYTKYCTLCHGDNREGYAADNAPSLRSKSLLGTSRSNNFMRYTIQFGRANTAMAGYMDSQGGPLEYIDIEILLKWLYEKAEVDESIPVSREPVYGDIANGANIYAQNCASCHGEKGEGISAPALGNPMTLATATDHFLRYAIAEGRDGTPMVAFKDSLSDKEIDDVTAFLRSRASGWDVPEPSTAVVPSPDEYVINPDSEGPVFTLREGKFVSAEQVDQALKEKKRMIILDARSEVAWRQMHIPGSIPVPYYEEPENFVNDLPNDDTQIVIYCACPHAASLRVMSTLKREGYKNLSIIDEGILVWAQMGFPVRNGK